MMRWTLLLVAYVALLCLVSCSAQDDGPKGGSTSKGSKKGGSKKQQNSIQMSPVDEEALLMTKAKYLASVQVISEEVRTSFNDDKTCTKTVDILQKLIDQKDCGRIQLLMVDVGACNVYHRCGYTVAVSIFDAVANACPQTLSQSLLDDVVRAYSGSIEVKEDATTEQVSAILEKVTEELQTLRKTQMETRDRVNGDPINSSEKEHNLLNLQRALGMVRREPELISSKSLDKLLEENMMKKCEYTRFTSDRERKAAAALSLFELPVVQKAVLENSNDEKMLDRVFNLLDAASGTYSIQLFIASVAKAAKACAEDIPEQSVLLHKFLTPIFDGKFKHRALATSIVAGIGAQAAPAVYGQAMRNQFEVLKKVWAIGMGIPHTTIVSSIKEIEKGTGTEVVAENIHKEIAEIGGEEFTKLSLSIGYVSAGLSVLNFARTMPDLFRNPTIRNALQKSKSLMSVVGAITSALRKTLSANAKQVLVGLKWASWTVAPIEAVITIFDMVWDGIMKDNIKVAVMKGVAFSLQVTGIVLQFIPGAGTAVGTLVFAIGTAVSIASQYFVYSPEQEFIKGLGYQLGDDAAARKQASVLSCSQIAELDDLKIQNIVGQMIDGITGKRDEKAIVRVVFCLAYKQKCPKVKAMFEAGGASGTTSMNKVLSDLSFGRLAAMKTVLKTRCDIDPEMLNDDFGKKIAAEKTCEELGKLTYFEKKQIMVGLIKGWTGKADEEAIVRILECMPERHRNRLSHEAGTSYEIFRKNIHKKELWAKASKLLTPKPMAGHNDEWVDRMLCSQIAETEDKLLVGVLDDFFKMWTRIKTEEKALKILKCLAAENQCEKLQNIVTHKKIGVKRVMSELGKHFGGETRAVLHKCEMPLSADDNAAQDWAKRVTCEKVLKLSANSLHVRVKAALDGYTGDEDSFALLHIFKCLSTTTEGKAVASQIIRFKDSRISRIKSDVSSKYKDELLAVLPKPNAKCYFYEEEVVALHNEGGGCERRTWGMCSSHRECKVADAEVCPHACYCGEKGINECKCVRQLTDEDICDFVGEL